jgi:hypothetical protein
MEIGYRNPPQHSRFQPGQSGNPAGRRKGVRNLSTNVRRNALNNQPSEIGPQPLASEDRAILAAYRQGIRAEVRELGLRLRRIGPRLRRKLRLPH